MSSKLFTKHVLVVDTETTGLPKHKHAVAIEVGAVLISPSGYEVASCGALVRCKLPLPKEADRAMEVNGIDVAHLAEAGGRMVASRMLWGIVKELDPVVTAFNVRFDKAMVEKTDLRFGSSTRWGRCIMLEAQSDMGVGKWPTLAEAAEYYYITADGQAHRAVTDARTAARVMVRIAQDRPGVW